MALELPTSGSRDGEQEILREAEKILADFKKRGVRLSRRQLAEHLRARGHTLSNARVPEIADAIGL